jgi:hypothetical protein
MVIVTGASPAAGADAGADAAAGVDAAAEADADGAAAELAAVLGDVEVEAFDLDDEQPAMTIDAAINALSVTIWPVGRL